MSLDIQQIENVVQKAVFVAIDIMFKILVYGANLVNQAIANFKP